MGSTIDLTIITPCFNEEETVRKCAERLRAVMELQLPNVNYEHIFADNCSTDSTFAILHQLSLEDERIKSYSLSRNIGALRNVYRALEFASGKAIIPMLPVDLQDPPEVISDFYKKYLEGFLIVYGERSEREENIILRGLRALYYRIIRRMSHSEIPLNSGEFMLIDRKIADSIVELNDQYPYVRGLVAITGANSTSVKYKWVKRKAGKSKASFLVLIDQAINGLVSTSKIPARIALFSGFLLSGIGFLFAVVLVIATLFGVLNSPSGIPTVVTLILLMSGAQLFFLGLIGEYVLSIHNQVRPMPKEFITEKYNF